MRDLRDLVAETEPEIVLCLGDLGFWELSGLDAVDLPTLGVHGNHCGSYFNELGITDVHLRVLDVAGIRFGGFEGCIRYREGDDHQYTQQEAFDLLADFPPVDVFLSHSPPYGVNDGEEVPHIGFGALNRYIETHHPRVMLHGHVYPTDPVPQYRGTRIEYVFGYRVVEI